MTIDNNETTLPLLNSAIKLLIHYNKMSSIQWSIPHNSDVAITKVYKIFCLKTDEILL